MLEFNVLILLSLTLIVICLFILFFLTVTKSRELKGKLKQELRHVIKEETPEDCQHYFGYLSSYPKNKPVPFECMFCAKTLECFEPS